MAKPRILFASSEVYPFAKSGGLADVSHSLPKALANAFDVTVLMPLYRFVDTKQYGIKRTKHVFDIAVGDTLHTVTLFENRFEGGRYLFVETPLLCDREYLYGPPDEGYDDNALRFGLFGHSIVRVAEMLQSRVVHLNDWQTALAALLLAQKPLPGTKTLFTIHNLAYQGIFDQEVLAPLGIDEKYFTPEGIEFYGNVNFMKAGIGFADAVTTVSPTYAGEIVTPAFGCGLEGYLKVNSEKLSGIVNGIDTGHFSPAEDECLYRTYKTPRGKASNKSAYLAETGLAGEEKPLFIFIGRFTWQKGIDILIEALDAMAGHACNIAILGEGESKYRESMLAAAEGKKNLHLAFGYDEALAHRMYAAADFLLMPSLFEPCGLNQLIAMHYGALPVVHRVGGLADTVCPFTECGTPAEGGCGITFAPATAEGLLGAFEEAMTLYGDAKRYRQTAAENMKADVSWHRSAEAYAQLYRKISGGEVE